MSKDGKHRALLDRRTLLQAGAASALAMPLGVFGAKAFPVAPPKIDFSEFQSAGPRPKRPCSRERRGN